MKLEEDKMPKGYKKKIRYQNKRYMEFSTHKNKAIWVMDDTLDRLKELKKKYNLASLEDTIIYLLEYYIALGEGKTE